MSNHLTEEQIQSYLDKQESIDTKNIEGHLELCASCQKEMEEYRELYAALTADNFLSLSQDFSSQIISAVSGPQESRWQLFESGFTIAFFLFGIAASLYFINPLPFLLKTANSIISSIGLYTTKFFPEINGSLPIFIVAILIFLLVEILDKKVVRSRL